MVTLRSGSSWTRPVLSGAPLAWDICRTCGLSEGQGRYRSVQYRPWTIQVVSNNASRMSMARSIQYYLSCSESSGDPRGLS
ncbi:hypothetical protein BDV30DRAFT_193957 [Aspergillus minisclerotigenes]|uniref:Uncharacterized protein n=1 Tax=Aspergillus minisclerotigenes TaxID=656917 RepID=A0A5N6JF93_9EURO|nr:hypothetical protein BDV30DRAFT_193957 [Aspergillus minisclerotigenes]